MKKFFSILFLLLFIISISACGASKDEPQASTENTAAVSNTANTADTVVYDYDSTEEVNENSDTSEDEYDCLTVFGNNYYCYTSFVYSGEDLTMRINVDNGSNERYGMGVYVVVNGIFVKSSIQEFSDEKFDKAISEKVTNLNFIKFIYQSPAQTAQ